MADIVLRTSGGEDLACREGDLFFPYRGNWTAHLTFATVPDTLPSGRVTLTFHQLVCNGYILRIGTSEGQTTAIIVGGRGGLWKVIEAKYYANQPQVRLPVNEVLTAGGETLSSESTQSILTQVLPSWPRRQDVAGNLLDALAEATGAIWRTLPDGDVYFGNDQPLLPLQNWQEDVDWQLLSTEPEWRMQEIAPLTRAGMLPGFRFSLGTISRVHYYDDGENFTARVWYLSEGGTDDLVIAGLRTIIREELKPTAFHPHFGGKVVQQRGDGTLDVQLDDRRLPPLTSVPYLVALPGAALEVSAGARCEVTFASGDPRQPFVQLYGNGQGTKPLGIDGDTVNCGTMTITAVANGVFVGTYVDPFGTTTTIALNTPIPLKGKLVGTAKLKAP